MFVRIPSASLFRRGRAWPLVALLGLLLFASCTTSEDTEPYVPAKEGATQPTGDGELLSEDDACARLLKAAKGAYDRLGCDAPALATCPGFLRPGGGSGCYEYYADSVAACETSYQDAASCRSLSPCLATAKRNDALATCEMLEGAGGAGGAGSSPVGGASGVGGAPPVAEAGAPAAGGVSAAGAAPVAGAGN